MIVSLDQRVDVAVDVLVEVLVAIGGPLSSSPPPIVAANTPAAATAATPATGTRLPREKADARLAPAAPAAELGTRGDSAGGVGVEAAGVEAAGVDWARAVGDASRAAVSNREVVNRIIILFH